ncbi:MAG: hypothetical protein EZS28_028997 [Streblomastix strix]|uniref:Uncharacterized protein n=1 Tax=Streblomastix strix TaxID=222440 RepID=A0A5J4V0B6_9EUKA|nr:MAG: hypothetical protein EZS28_028997 [Streblomastix strix]
MSFYGKKQDDILSKYGGETEPKSLDLLSMRSLAYNIIQDQIQAQAITKNMINNGVGGGDPLLVAISNVNAQIAFDIANKEQPAKLYEEREDIIQEGTQKEKEQVLQKDKYFETKNNQQQLGNDVLIGVPPASPIVDPQQQKSQVQEQAEQNIIEDLQVQEMIKMNDAINYKFGSLDWGLNSLNVVQFPEKIVIKKVNQVKIKKNFISENQMIATKEAQEELKKKYGKKSLKKKKTKSS